MMKGINPSCVYDFSDHHFSSVSAAAAAAADYNDRVDDAIYGSDEFRMYAYKIKRCPRMRSHDWTECPYAHRGEKAQRRDPRKFNYSAIVCPAFRNGASCSKGDTCEFAHGVFEYWLHPARYRTRACNSGQLCQRKVCFFAHSPDQLRPETKSKRHSHFAYRPTAAAAAAREPAEVVLNRCGSDHLDHKDGAGGSREKSRKECSGSDQLLILIPPVLYQLLKTFLITLPSVCRNGNYSE
ncbi:hypothetical protein G4B88_028720 [Cannabis sativa]|uniref:C3H1-type domain-containing protein n=1 Tax=Cannabis sativa TaxID=3483 RepID=A0A7J6EW51_CANSA|nr:hypothetical protein G4B88_028720 [Cannabis sativa]